MTCDAVGGVWQYATDLAAGLAGEGVEVALAVLGPLPRHPDLEPGSMSVPGAVPEIQAGSADRAWMPGQARHDGIEVFHPNLPLDWLAAGPEDVLAAARSIAALAAGHAADVVHLNSPALAAVPFPVPVIAAAHGCVGTWCAALGEEPGPDLAWHGELVGRGLRAADAVVAPSAAYAAAVQHRYGLAAAPQVVHNGRTTMGLPAVGPADHVLTAGRLWDRAKNTALLDAVAALIPVPLRAAGPVIGPHGETAVTRHLQLLGTLSEAALATEYARAPILVSAARFEPFGLAVLEAAQAGCPLVLSGIDTFRELWTGAALFVAADDPADYAAAIARIRGDAGLRAHLGEAARIRAARYTPAAMTAGMLAIYRALLARPARAAA